ncbi:hypothetical protein HDU88_004649 [Geranomyces variabilis]|nr:hypothetical protein HDU88_004649 [Geranomyces variabilis]
MPRRPSKAKLESAATKVRSSSPQAKRKLKGKGSSQGANSTLNVEAGADSRKGKWDQPKHKYLAAYKEAEIAKNYLEANPHTFNNPGPKLGKAQKIEEQTQKGKPADVVVKRES